jgi:hypothetical protein
MLAKTIQKMSQTSQTWAKVAQKWAKLVKNATQTVQIVIKTGQTVSNFHIDQTCQRPSQDGQTFNKIGLISFQISKTAIRETWTQNLSQTYYREMQMFKKM